MIMTLLESKKWRKIANRPGFDSTEFEFKCRGWKKTCRFVAVREVIIREIEGEDLLSDLTKIHYDYFCYVSNMEVSPMASGSILPQDFWV